MGGMMSAALLFLLGFSLHNIEEALWLPAWSQKAKRFHEPVGPDEFRFAVIMVTALGYFLTFTHFLLLPDSPIFRYAYLGFIAMMVLNAVFPHLASTIVLRSYCPGLSTGLALNIPVGLFVLCTDISGRSDALRVLGATVVITAVVLVLLPLWFRAGRALVGGNDDGGVQINRQ